MKSTPHRTRIISGWGKYPKVECLTYRPEKQRTVSEIFKTHKDKLTFHGQGRSYGDASLLKEGTLLTERLNRFLAFDVEKGLLSAEAGVTIKEILSATIPKGWLPPVIPGTQYATLGGAIACNIHGKNQYTLGNLASHITSFTLLLPSGKTITCTPAKEKELFEATLGGMGMTGFIREATVQLIPIQSASVKTHTKRVGSLTDMLTLFAEHKESADYMVAWLDHTGKGMQLGRGVFEYASPATVKQGGLPCKDYAQKKGGITIPSCFPGFIMNRYTMRLYNRYRFGKYSDSWREEIQPFDTFFHPLDGMKQWNNLYGKKGLLQLQCLIPENKDTQTRLRSLLETIQQHGLFSYLAVLKYHKKGKGLLAFDRKGYSLALDFPNTLKARKLQEMLNGMIADWGGRVYLAKDATLAPEQFERMYSDALPTWRKVLKDVDPTGKMHSQMATRLGFRGKE